MQWSESAVDQRQSEKRSGGYGPLPPTVNLIKQTPKYKSLRKSIWCGVKHVDPLDNDMAEDSGSSCHLQIGIRGDKRLHVKSFPCKFPQYQPCSCSQVLIYLLTTPLSLRVVTDD